MEALFAPFVGRHAGLLAQGLIVRFGGLSRAMGAAPNAAGLAAHEREALRIVRAAREIVSAACAETVSGSPVDPRDPALREYLRVQLSFSPVENALVIFVDSWGSYVGEEVVATGGRGSLLLPISRIARRALELGAGSVLLAHNHPSGSELPSSGDRESTKAFTAALALIEVELLDHLIVTRGAVYSMKRGERL